ncbi:TonB-dependent receptor domain-containing protein [Flavihumibacter profundi]|uniref:TonB-dependent receptor domain-containing protein n=1 Tax=Flavihumibacter profundi TaxID=2716883 RepID=UPI001CC7C34E|nr:TonB-dependent receptor [Flavihumibacter profundi]MBZ5855916.1 TonB-dependent receptor [Flavihumibacter profundi]
MLLIKRFFVRTTTRILLLNLVLISYSISVSAQQAPAERLKITGKVIDQKTGKGLESATIKITRIQQDSTHSADSSGRFTITDKQGGFAINSAQANAFHLTITAVGFEKLEKNLLINEAVNEFNAGKFELVSSSTNLENVVVTAKKPVMVLGVDRRTYNADGLITSKGGNAVDVMKNIPSLSVGINGVIEMRNSTPQILVDGRPTILTLEQIPADDIDKVEVITNPSSKYDAGSTGGIINIILKKNRQNGLNGVFNIGAGSPQLFNSNLSLNLRQGKVNVFASGNYNSSGGVTEEMAYRENRSAGVATDYFNQETSTDRQRKFSSIRFGADYFINPHNTLTFSQGFVSGRFNNTQNQQQVYLDKNQAISNTGTRYNLENDYFNRSSTQLNYRRTYKKTGKEWTADITYNSGNNGGDGIINNQLFEPDGQPSGPVNHVAGQGSGSGRQFTFQTDYENQINEKSKIELGARSYHNNSTNKLDVYSMGNTGEIKLPLSNNYRFTEMVNAVYSNYSNVIGKLKYQGGIRIEQSTFKGELPDSSESFGYDYPSGGKDLWNAFFPSLYLTYPITEGNDIQLNFSRRIRRPNFWEINPYVDISDPMNIRKGNPELQPEFTNSFELNYNRQYKTGSVLVSLYYHNNTADITTYSDTISQAELTNLNNAAISPNAIMSTFINADRTNRTGMEITWRQKFGDNMDITPSFGAQYRDVKATVNGLNLSNYGLNWNSKLMVNYKIVTPKQKLTNNISFQLSGRYESPRVMPQGSQKERYSMDFAARKDFLKKKAGTLTFSINDVLNSWKYGSITDTENFYQDAYQRWNVRSFRLTFSYRFGNHDLDLFKRKETNTDEDRG